MAPESDTTAFERLSALDRAFLSIEDERDPMHIALLGIFAKGPLVLDDGKLDRERLRLYSRDVIASLPKFRRRVVTVRWLGATFLCDDPEFDLDYHVRFVELEAPGNEAVRAALSQWSRRAPSTSLNPRHVGAIRRFDWLRLDFERVRAMKRAAGVTVNDVVLATVAGGLRLYLQRHGVDPSPLRLRAMVPVSLHKPGESHIRNELSLMLTELPVDEADPKRRLERIAEATRRAKSSGQSRALGVLEVACGAQCAGRHRNARAACRGDPPVQRDRHERAGAGLSALPARCASPGRFAARAALREPVRGHRRAELRGRALLRIQRGRCQHEGCFGLRALR
jgi:hypothetical protein